MSDFDAPLRLWSEALVGTVLRLGWGLKIAGRGNVPASGPLIVAFNHANLLDGPLTGVAVAPTRHPSFLAKKELFAYPVLGSFLRAAGVVPLDRASADHAALRFALETLDKGGSIALSPEGTRVKPGQTRAPKPGVGFLAAKSGAPVLPVRLVGTARFPFAHPVTVRVGAPLPPPPRDAGREAAAVFARAVMAAIYSL